MRQLRLIGHHDITGYWTPEVLKAWRSSGREVEITRRVKPPQLRRMLERGEVEVVDVRGAGEHAAGRIAGSRNIPLDQLQRRLAELPDGRPLVLHCQGGLRSVIAASVLQRAGFKDVLDLEGGLGAWQAEGEPSEQDG